MNAQLSSSLGQELTESKGTWIQYSKGIAWWTIALFFFVVVGYVGLLAGIYSQAISLPMGTLIATVLLYLGFTVVHEAGHGNIAHEVHWMKPIERAMGWVTTQFFLVVPFALFAKIHDYHHAFTNDPDRDPDHWVSGDTWLEASLRAPTLAFSYIFATFTKFKDDPVISKTHKSSLIYYAISVSMVVGLISAGYGIELLMIGILPIFLSSYVLGMLFDWIPHKPTRLQGRYQNTRSYLFPGLRFLALGQNYHHIHHLYPRVSWYSYHKVFNAIRPELEAKNAPIETLFSGLTGNSGFGFGKSPYANEPNRLDSFQKMTLSVSSLSRETEDSVAITFEQPWERGLRFKAGQYVTISKLVDGNYVTRCYSICESPNSEKLTIGVKKVEGGVLSTYLNEALKIGDQLTVSGPFGDFIYEPAGSDLDNSNSEGTDPEGKLILIAGGSGITPVLSIARTALSSEPTKQVHLIYANRDIANVMFIDAINLLQVNYPQRFQLSYVFEKGHSGWDGETGYLTAEKLHSMLSAFKDTGLSVLDKSEFYICGPKPMKDAVISGIEALNLSSAQVHVEEFSQSLSKPEGKLHSVEINMANGVSHSLRVAENQTVLQAAVQEGIQIPHACGVGQCGCCMMRVGQGEVVMMSDNTPGLLPDEKAQGFTLACQCKPASDLTLNELKH